MALPILKDAWAEVASAYDSAKQALDLPASPPTSHSHPALKKIPADRIMSTFQGSTTDLLSAPLGTRILSLSDEFFVPASNLTNPEPPTHKPRTFIETGQWYDGWETRRHNPAAYDYVVFGLGVRAGRPRGVEIDTGFFNGNHAPAVSVEACFLEGTNNDDDATQRKREDADDVAAQEDFTGWETILPRVTCGPACRQAWLLPPAPTQDQNKDPEEKEKAYTHIRLRMYPDGGIARIRLYGHVVPSFPPLSPSTSQQHPPIDLASVLNGGIATSSSDQHFGHRSNLLLPGRGKDMGDGWETRRSRGDGHVDWAVVRLGAEGVLDKIVVDTMHFRGNFPQWVQVFAAERLPKQETPAAAAGNCGSEAGARDGVVGGGGRGGGSDEKKNERVLSAGFDLDVMDGVGGAQHLLNDRAAPPSRDHGYGDEPAPDSPRWVQVVAPAACRADTEHEFVVGKGLENVEGGRVYGWVKLVMIPDGGVKRLRVWGRRVG